MGMSLVTHSRLRFILNLLTLLQAADSLRRVVSVGAASCEGAIDTSNLLGEGFSVLKLRDQFASMQTLLLEEVSRRAPDVSLVHDVPGVVESGITRDAQGLQATMMIAVARLLRPLISTPTAECGERHVFLATSAMFPPRESKAIDGVPLKDTATAARGSNGTNGSGTYTLDNKCVSSPSRAEEILRAFRDNGTAKLVWESIASDLKRITGTEVALDSD